MNNETYTNGVTRRSFIKRSIVAAVAVSSMTIFSGLVNAAGETPSPGEGKCVVDQCADLQSGCFGKWEGGPNSGKRCAATCIKGVYKDCITQ